jgi:hypothetical protein
MRWDPYVLIEGEESVRAFWAERCREQELRSLVVVLGEGFDRRMCLGVEAIRAACPAVSLRGILLALGRTGSTSGEMPEQTRLNLARLGKVPNFEFSRVEIARKTVEGKRIASESVFKKFQDLSQFDGASDVIIDISSLPRDIFMTLIAVLLARIDSAQPASRFSPSLHILAAESPSIDRAIRVDGIAEDLTFIQGFRGGFDIESSGHLPKVWIPILGERRLAQLAKLYMDLNPAEVCPLVPFPAIHLRRADALIGDYHGLLFDTFRVEPRNIIYAAEDNPFQVYREIRRTALDYRETLTPLGGAKIFVSPLSSKLTTVGALLACYELRHGLGSDCLEYVGIAHVPGEGHWEEHGTPEPTDVRLFSIWIAGEAYA